MSDRDRANNKVADSHHRHGKRAGVSLLAVGEGAVRTEDFNKSQHRAALRAGKRILS